MTTSRKVTTRSALTAGALAVTFAAASLTSASAAPVPTRPSSVGQSVAAHDHRTHVASLTTDQVAARQQLRTAIAELVTALRAGDESAAQAAVTKVIAASKAVKAADAAAEAQDAGNGDEPSKAGDHESSTSGDDATEASDESTGAAPVVKVHRKEVARERPKATDPGWSGDGQRHSAAWHNRKSWTPAHDSRDRHEGDRKDGDRRDGDHQRGDRHEAGSHHGSRHGDHHRSGR